MKEVNIKPLCPECGQELIIDHRKGAREVRKVYICPQNCLAMAYEIMPTSCLLCNAPLFFTSLAEPYAHYCSNMACEGYELDLKKGFFTIHYLSAFPVVYRPLTKKMYIDYGGEKLRHEVSYLPRRWQAFYYKIQHLCNLYLAVCYR